MAWSTVKYATTAENGFVDGSLDTTTIVERTFKTYVLENRYLKVTLLPEFGGRILSIIYKPTGHEELYRNEVGVPYGMKGGIFYYDWMMVYGGIFPTFPDAEHGKTWLKPWDFRVVKEGADQVTVSMSLKDDFAYSAPPKQFRQGSTGLEATLYVTLTAGRAAIDVRVVLKNPKPETIDYEYWTCTTLAPGSDPKHPQTTGGAEIIAPIEAYSTPHWSANLSEGDESTGPGKFRFENLRYFKNWSTAGIAYAAPNMQGGNFWGVINHDNEEGIIRIADNKVTPGLKMWTWGFPSFANAADARKNPNPAQPYVELWAGASDEFFHSATFPALGEVSIAETYSPTIGMSNVTHANENVLVNLSAAGSSVNLQFVSLAPATALRVTLKRGDGVLFDDAVTADPKHGNNISATIPEGGSGEKVQLTITTAAGKELIAADTKIR
jgi:archaellin